VLVWKIAVIQMLCAMGILKKQANIRKKKKPETKSFKYLFLAK